MNEKTNKAQKECFKTWKTFIQQMEALKTRIINNVSKYDTWRWKMSKFQEYIRYVGDEKTNYVKKGFF